MQRLQRSEAFYERSLVMSDRYITLPAKCCGTCQYWSGDRGLMEYGRRLRCEGSAQRCPFYPSPSHAFQPCRCVQKRWKQWVNLP